MDNIVFLIIAGIAFVINTLLNYNKEKQKNAKRNIQLPKKVVTQPTTTIPTPPKKRKVNTQPIPSIYEEKPLNAAIERNSFDSETMRQIEKYQSNEDIYNTFEEQEELQSLSEDDEIGNEHKKSKKSSAIRFETKEDFKKAIIYSTILERKY